MTIEPVTATRHSFTASDGVELSYCLWSRGLTSERRTLALILHGIGFYAEPYVAAAENIHIQDSLFAGLDFRGHGRSGGPRGELPPLKRMLADIGEWVSHLRASLPAARLFLFAESMAGPYAALYASHNPDAFKGIVLVAPAVILSWRQIAHPNTFKALLALLRRPSARSVELGGSRLAAGSRDAGFISVRSADALALQSVSPRYILRIGYAAARMALRRPLSTNAPLLIVHGAKDNILSPLGSRLLKLRFSSPNKRLVIVPGAYHTLLWDPSSREVFDIVEQWLSACADADG